MRRPVRLLITGLAAAVAVLMGWFVLQMPMDVPDSSSPPITNHFHPINDALTVGQTFRVERDGLFRISVVIAAEEPVGDAEITFALRETLDGEPLRVVSLRVADLPRGRAEIYAPGTISERWHSFEFDPIWDSAGREFYFSLEGEEVPAENGAGAALFFHNRYDYGEAHQNGEAIGAHVVFRAHSHGQVSDLLSVISRNLTAEKPGPLSQPLPYLVLGALYLAFAVAAIRVAART